MEFTKSSIKKIDTTDERVNIIEISLYCNLDLKLHERINS